MAIQYLTSAEKIGKVGNMRKLATDSAELLETHFPAAQRRVIKKIGQEKYTAMLAVNPESGNEADVKDKLLITQAESLIVLYYAAQHLGSINTGDGFKQSAGIGDGRSENISTFDILRKREEYLNDAEEILQEFAVVPKDANDNPKMVSTPHLKMFAV